MTTEEKIRMLETDNRLQAEKIKKLDKEKKLLLKEIGGLREDLADVEEYVDVKRCVSCNHLSLEETMGYVGNEIICQNCRVNGYGR